MKFTLLLATVALLSSASTCKGRKTELPEGQYRGRLEVKGGCMNYTIAVVGGAIDPSRVEASWTDETTGKSYKNAFALASRCTFPTDIKEGDEFLFTIDSSAKQDCAVCMMYYPTPSKSLPIKVVR